MIDFAFISYTAILSITPGTNNLMLAGASGPSAGLILLAAVFTLIIQG